jgi:hypothetical protein
VKVPITIEGVEMGSSDDGPSLGIGLGDSQTRMHWAMQALAELQRLVSARCTEIPTVLQDEASDFASTYTERMLRERRARPASERGSIGLRVRRTARSAPGSFQIEWYRVRGKQRTQYLKRGKDSDGRVSPRYRLSAFGRVTEWEQDLIRHYEPQFARLRVVQSHIGRSRRRFALIAQALRQGEAPEHDRESADAPW